MPKVSHIACIDFHSEQECGAEPGRPREPTITAIYHQKTMNHQNPGQVWGKEKSPDG